MNLEEHAMTMHGLAIEMASQLDAMGVTPSSNDYQLWLNYKAMERYATDKRRAIEDELFTLHRLGEHEGTDTIKANGFKVKVTQRFNRSIDADLLQEVAAEHSLESHLADLFRWKPEINAKAWAAADDSITGPMLAAITTKPGRPSFSIEKIEE